jgi:putative transposase
VDYVRYWKERTELPSKRLVGWIGIGQSKFYDWQDRYGKVNEHNAWVPRDWWLQDWEKEAIVSFHWEHPLEGYRRLTFMMLDADVVAVSPTSVYRVLKKAGLMNRHPPGPSKKGQGFAQPLGPHQHWHIDISYLNLAGTFYYMCSILDGYSRLIVHWEIRESMTEPDVETIVQRAKEQYPKECPRIISDNGPQFIAKDFKEFIRLCGMTHVRTSPYYPQSNGKLERYHRTIKGECIRPGTPLSLGDARRLVARYVEHYNTVRLHSAIGYITPAEKLAGREQEIFAERDRKLDQARQSRKARREVARGAQPDGRVDFAAIRSQVTIGQVLHRLGHLDRLQVIGSERRGPCPVHGGDDGHQRSFSANIEKNVFRCFSPSCGAGGNVLDLWAAVHKLPLREAALDLVETFHLDVRNPEKRQPVLPLPQSDRPVAIHVATRDNVDSDPRPITTQPLPQRR